jgi:hypothetical protein
MDCVLVWYTLGIVTLVVVVWVVIKIEQLCCHMRRQRAALDEIKKICNEITLEMKWGKVK